MAEKRSGSTPGSEDGFARELANLAAQHQTHTCESELNTKNHCTLAIRALVPGVLKETR